jgi:hypothetical protein
VRTLRAPPPAWLESGTPPDNSSRHIIAAGTFAAADPAHIIVAGSERRAPRPPLAHPPTLAHTACRTALAPARSRSHDLYTTHGTHLDKRPSALHVPSVAIVKLAAVAIVKLSRRRCRKPPLSQAAAVRCRDGQASAVAMVKLALSRWSSRDVHPPRSPPAHSSRHIIAAGTFAAAAAQGGTSAPADRERRAPRPPLAPPPEASARPPPHQARRAAAGCTLLPHAHRSRTAAAAAVTPIPTACCSRRTPASVGWCGRPACPPAARRPPPPPPPPPTRGGRTTPLNPPPPHTSVT